MPRVLLLCVAVCLLAADTKKEEGFKPLFNGKDYTGWKTLARGKTKAVSLDGKEEAYGGRFKVKDGKMVLDPKVKGDVRIETAKSYAGDVTIRFEFFPGPKCNNDLFFRGQKFDLSKENIKGFELGKWHTLEITVKGDDIEFKYDGESKRKGKVKGKGGTPFGVRAEFGEMEIRNMRIKE
jgi:hypothetical protein